jgi:uncharacterized protein
MENTALKYVLLYESADDVLEKAPLHGAAHRTWWNQFLDDGTLLMVGPFANPKDGAMAVFKTREAAEAFAAGDPFVLNGVVRSWRIAEWLEAISK